MTVDHEVVEGRVDRILGSYETTDVSVTEHTTTHEDHQATMHGAASTMVSHPRIERHTFVDTTREFAMILEVRGRTLKLVHDDYLAVGVGDAVRAVCRPQRDGPLLVHEWRNVTRGIRFRTLPRPLAGAAKSIFVALVLLILGAVFSVAGGAHGGWFFSIVGLGLLGSSVFVARDALARAKDVADAHRRLDALGR